MIGEALRLIRVFNDLKQNDLAARIGVSKSYISEVENGNKDPSLDLIEKYSVEFNMPISSILFFAEELPNAKAGEKVRTKIAGTVLNILKFVERKSDGKEVA